MRGLEEALAFAKGDKSRARVHHIDVPAIDYAALIEETKLAGAKLDFEALAAGQEEILRRAVADIGAHGADPAEAQLDIARAAFRVALANLRALRLAG